MFELDDSGERIRIAVPEEDLQLYLHPEQVFVIVKEQLRRIYIWKGAKAAVRKRFISSRIASELQEELVKQAAFHRCKIVSVDQGDEPEEFLRTFRLESMKVEEKMEDLRYVRNIERETPERFGDVLDNNELSTIIEEEEYFSPALQELKKKGINIDQTLESETPTQKMPPPKIPPKMSTIRSNSPPSYVPYQSNKNYGLNKEQEKSLMEKILKLKVPENHVRQNLILGNALYGAVSKTVNVFGKNVEETEWEPISQLPVGMVEVDDAKLRIYIDNEKNIIEAIEILKDTRKTAREDGSMKLQEKKNMEQITKNPNLDHMTVKELKQYSSNHKIDLQSSVKKADIIRTIKDYEGESKSNPKSSRRNLPKIPTNDD